jgi:hypothetical protein
MHTISRSVTANEALFAAVPAGLLLEQRLAGISMGWAGTAWNFVLYWDACLTG